MGVGPPRCKSRRVVILDRKLVARLWRCTQKFTRYPDVSALQNCIRIMLLYDNAKRRGSAAKGLNLRWLPRALDESPGRVRLNLGQAFGRRRGKPGAWGGRRQATALAVSNKSAQPGREAVSGCMCRAHQVAEQVGE
jgi:hypothetical protein